MGVEGQKKVEDTCCGSPSCSGSSVVCAEEHRAPLLLQPRPRGSARSRRRRTRAAASISLARQLPLVFRSRSLASQAAVLLQLQAANRALSRRAERARSRVAEAREGEGERGQVCRSRSSAERGLLVDSWAHGHGTPHTRRQQPLDF